MKTFLVDDSPTTRATLAAPPRREGMGVEAVLQAARREAFDLVLGDVMMPA